MRGGRGAALAGVALAAAALALSGCGSNSSQKQAAPGGNRIKGDRLVVYVSVPKYGPSAAAGRSVLDGARLALDGDATIGRYHLRIQPKNDADPKTGAWSAALTTQNAQLAAANHRTVAYLGDFNSGASAVSIPILNRLAIPQVSATSTAVGLTSDGPGSSPGEQPIDYYPTPLRTFARVVPGDLTQADVQVKLQQEHGCATTYVLDDGEYDGSAAGAAFDEVAQKRGLTVIGKQSYVPGERNYRSIGHTIEQSGADCLLVTAITDTDPAAVVKQIASVDRSIRIFATAGLAQSAFLDQSAGGVPYTLDHRLIVTAAAGTPQSADADNFWKRYDARYGSGQLVALDGYEAMSLLLGAIRRASDNGTEEVQRVKVVSSLFSTRKRRSILGTYGIRHNGDTTLNSYGVYRVRHGALRYWKAMAG